MASLETWVISSCCSVLHLKLNQFTSSPFQWPMLDAQGPWKPRVWAEPGGLDRSTSFRPFPSHTYLADVSLYFMKHLKIQENTRITLCETQPGPNERLTAFGRGLGRTFHTCPIFLLFSFLSRFFFFFEATITSLLNKIWYSIKDWSMAKTSTFLLVILQNVLLKVCSHVIFLVLNSHLWEHTDMSRRCWFCFGTQIRKIP